MYAHRQKTHCMIAYSEQDRQIAEDGVLPYGFIYASLRDPSFNIVTYPFIFGCFRHDSQNFPG